MIKLYDIKKIRGGIITIQIMFNADEKTFKNHVELSQDDPIAMQIIKIYLMKKKKDINADIITNMKNTILISL